MMGRLASIVAKELLSGNKVVVVRCEAIVISGSLMRNKVKYAQFRRKHMNTNPRKGPFHFRSPARMLWRTIRGMVPHKTQRGSNALANLATYEGVPVPYDKMKRLVVPEALQAIRLQKGRRMCLLGSLAKEVGWGHGELVASLETQRKTKEQTYYATKTKAVMSANNLAKDAKLAAINKTLSSKGF